MNKLNDIIQDLVKKKSPKKDLACAFIWYHYVTTNEEPTINVINDYFSQNHLPKYNQTYLKEDLKKSKNVTKGSNANSYKPQRQYLGLMASLYPFAELKSEDIITDDIIIPDILVENTRGYIKTLSQQINASYNYNIFDGCAILMRRLLEILLIHSYEEKGFINDIKENDGYRNLSYIINHASSNKPFSLSKEVIETLDEFRQLGNFAAHKIQYNTKRKDIDNIRLRYRMTIEELLYASGIKK